MKTCARTVLAALAVAAASPALAQPSAGPGTICTLGRVYRTLATSRSCLTCHDGTSGPAAAYGKPEDVGQSTLSAMHTSHPIEVNYAAAQAQKPDLLHPLPLVPRKLVLQEGKVACITCHDGNSDEPKHVAVSMSRSRLCTGCHAY